MLGALLDPRRWLARVDLPRGPTALLIVAAVAVGVGAYEHAHLYHQGYDEIATIGTLFVVNAVASLLVILALLARRPLAFVVGSLAISVGSIVALLLTRSSSGLFGFRESGYDAHATITLGAEIVAVVLTLVGALAAGRALAGPPAGAERPRPGRTDSLRTVTAVAVTILLGGVTIGVGQRGAEPPPLTPAEPETTATTPGGGTTTDGGAAPGGDAATGDGAVSGVVADRGRALFAERCGGCHRLSDAGTSGRIGPDLDTAISGQTAEQVRESIVDPDARITSGFPAGRMPSFADELSAQQLAELVDYLIAVGARR